MIPVAGMAAEVEMLRKIIDQVGQHVMQEAGARVEYMVGTMIELPRACLTANEIAAHAQFFSYGTNDLTQTTFGFSRDDVEGKFMEQYIDKAILGANPFDTIDRPGVGKMIEIGNELGRKTNPDLEIGICGEHGGEPASVEFCHEVGMDYVSCSPLRVPIARVAAAKAAIEEQGIGH
jgi:pyruvate,orthophosphate dikinase